MKTIVTGSGGFVGSYLCEYLTDLGHSVVGVDIDALDLLDFEKTKSKIINESPDVVFHLASQSSPAISWKDPYSTLSNNIDSTLNILRLAEQFKFKLVIAGSAEVYDTEWMVDAKTPILNEDSVKTPRNPYGLSKLLIDLLIEMIADEKQINVTLLRLFNHVGPKQSDRFVVSTFAKQLARIKLGLQKPEIKVGNLDAKRDMIDVRDAVKAYEKVINENEFGGVYNVCSGKAYKIEWILNKLIEISGLDVTVTQDLDRMRPSDIPIFLGNYSKFQEKFNWNPEIDITQTLKDTYEYWIEELK